jgi:cytochrome c-type biogenesis protein CcmH
MIVFWLLVAALVVAGASLFLPALRGRARADLSQRRRWNVLIHQQRRRELAAESLDDEQTTQLAAELDRELLNNLEAAAMPLAQPATSGRLAVLIGLGAAIGLGVALYTALGRFDLIQGLPAPPAAASSPAEIAAAIEQLAKRLAENPNDMEGWALLGRSLQATGQPDRAATAYEFALKLAPEDLDLKALYAQALAEAQQGSLAGKPAGIIAEILSQDAEHQTGLWLAGLAAAERRDISNAVGYWQKLKSLLPPDSKDIQTIDQYIAQVQALPPVKAAPKQSSPATSSAAASIRVTVTLDEKLKNRVSPEDAVFIFARAASGPPMPLAVVRKKVRDLPLEVTLDDAMAMMPERKLSSFEQIVIGARISKSGQPMPSSGDLQGLSPPVPSKTTRSQTIEVHDIVP